MTLIHRYLFWFVLVMSISATAVAEPRIVVAHPTIYYVRSDGSNNNSGLGNNKTEAWADPQYALLYAENSLDFQQFDVTIHVDASTTKSAWKPSRTGYVCNRLHLGSGRLFLEGERDGSTVIDGSINGGAAISATNGCELYVQDLTLKSGPGGNSLQSIAQSRMFFQRIRWGEAAGAHAFVSQKAIMEQIGDDIIDGSAAYHIIASHGGHFRAVSITTTFARDVRFRYFAFSEALGDITYTGSPPAPYPKFNLNGKKVGGIRCSAENLAIVQAASYGPDFFPGDTPCLTAKGGEVID
jgi:hypothetical protein